eukprot:scaffold1248_cov122-Isochrysis_galbana.AAC.6
MLAVLRAGAMSGARPPATTGDKGTIGRRRARAVAVQVAALTGLLDDSRGVKRGLRAGGDGLAALALLGDAKRRRQSGDLHLHLLLRSTRQRFPIPPD